jgi:hypothetical protein
MAGKKDPQDPAWRYITVALAFGQKRARDNAYRWKGDACFVVSAIALGAVILTRRGIKPSSGKYLIPTENPTDIGLAHADHYLHMRGEAARLGPNWRWKLEAQTEGYDAVKRGVSRLRDLPWAGIVDVPGVKDFSVLSTPLKALGEAADWALRESDKPLSAPSEDSQYWGQQGIEDGLADHRLNPGIDNGPDWFKQLQGG